MTLPSALFCGCDNTVLVADLLPPGATLSDYPGSLAVCNMPPTPGANAITNATNASPIVITSANHGLTTGQEVMIVGVGGNGAAKGVWTVTVVDANTFSLNSSAGSAAYTRGGEWFLTAPDLVKSITGSISSVVYNSGLVPNTVYLLIFQPSGTYRDHWNVLRYLRAVDNMV